jgi:hypothetical protein
LLYLSHFPPPKKASEDASFDGTSEPQDPAHSPPAALLALL